MSLAAYATETNKNFLDILFTAETKLDDTVSEHFLHQPGYRAIQRD